MVKMTSPDPKDVLLLYIAASYSAVSAALVLERERVKGKRSNYLFISYQKLSLARSSCTQS